MTSQGSRRRLLSGNELKNEGAERRPCWFLELDLEIDRSDGECGAQPGPR
jgi:hypothetical protein